MTLSPSSFCSQTCSIIWRCLPLRRTWRTPACMSLPAMSVLCSWTALPPLTDYASRTTSCPYPAITQNLLVKCDVLNFIVFYFVSFIIKPSLKSFQTHHIPYLEDCHQFAVFPTVTKQNLTFRTFYRCVIIDKQNYVMLLNLLNPTYFETFVIAISC